MPHKLGKDRQGRPKYEQIKVQLDPLFNNALSPEATYLVIVHELAHLYCRPIGTLCEA
jgi:predicted metal-dependent hydrolase